MLKRLLFRTILLSAFGITSSFAGECLYETSFEKGVDKPDGWTPPKPRSDWQWEEQGHTGKRCIGLIGLDKETAAATWVSDPIPLETRRVYRLTFWYKVEDKAGKASISMGAGRVHRSFSYSKDWRQDSLLFRVPPDDPGTRVQFHLWRTEARYFLDDVSIESVGVAYQEQDGLALGQFEKIENGTYLFNWLPTSQTTNICRVVDTNTAVYLAPNIRMYQDKEIVFRFDLGRFKQLSGQVGARVPYYEKGELVASASKDGKAWTEIGRMSETPNVKALNPPRQVEFKVPADLYPADCLFVKMKSTGYLHINNARYTATLSDSPPDLVGRTTLFSGHFVKVDNGPLMLRFDQSFPALASIRLNNIPVGTLWCKVAQFEKEGAGYKGTGIDSSDATRITAIDLTKKDTAECVVDVIAERASSEPAKRKFQAKYQLTLCAGQPWFKSKVISIKNTDSIGYTLKGYYHLLTPETADVKPVCYPTVAAWLSKTFSLGALMDESEPFALGLRMANDIFHGDITHSLDVKLNPGMTWQGAEPEIVIFAIAQGDAKAAYRESIRIRRLINQPPDEIASGRIEYEERKEKEDLEK